MGFPAEYPPQPWETENCKKPTERYFCFNAQVPTPKEILEVGYDAHIKLSEMSVEDMLREQEINPTDGYHWNIVNWGTKWDVYFDAITKDEMGWHDGANYICFHFDTAWSPPLAWLKKVALKFPELQFKLHYEEPGVFFAGDFYVEGEESKLNEYTDEQCRDLFSDLFDFEADENEK